ncbi:helix-turn-helix transcriptional regulator [Oryzomonas sagensis]|uniref:Helix-turn-helix transcriptional regulator n=1 Tax=Oryzomonas sagensis TaxID=2603857 RepID=A0ABQ6TM00_9BACT|nr:helix-turn-helix transcriptional regulator [Oryzomonas sagensis]KAB0669051.1 helix-turn-helix transcriptional regulator [Oryzomonas sagensis]
MAGRHAIYKPLTIQRAGIALCGKLYRLETSATDDPAEVKCKVCLSRMATGLPVPPKRSYQPKEATELDRYIGGRIRMYRSELRMSQTEFGKRTGMSQTWVSQLELGRMSVDLLKLITYADMLGKKIDDFLPPRRKGKMIF